MERSRWKSVAAIRIVALFIASTMGMTAFAGINQWTKLGPEGGGVDRVFYHPDSPSFVYAATHSGMHRSTDGGASWQRITNSTSSYSGSISFDPSNLDRMYHVVNSRAFRSIDRGAAFTELPPISVGGFLAVTVSSDGTVYAVTNAFQVFRSTNQGQSWVQQGVVAPNPSPLSDFFADPVNATTLYAQLFNSGLYVSTDGGMSWLPRGLGAPDGLAYASDFIFDPQTPTRIWAIASSGAVLVSNDSGNTWTVAYASSPSNYPQWATSVALNPANPAQVYVGLNDGRILVTQNQGVSWTVVGNRGERINAFAVNPAQLNQLMVASVSGLATGTVGGTSWTPRNAGIIASSGYYLTASNTTGRIYFLSDAGVFYFEGDTPVAAANNTALLQAAPEMYWFSGLHVQPDATDTLLLTGGVNNDLLRSSDAGATWTAGPATPGQVRMLTSERTNKQILYAAAASGIHKSIDGGVHWAAINSGLPTGSFGPEVQTVAVGGGSLVYAGTPAGVYKSINAGQSWVAANSGISDRRVFDIALDPTNDQVMLAATTNSIWRSADGGASWLNTNLPDSSASGEHFAAVKFDSGNPRVAYVLTTARVFRSIDAGASWQALNERQPGPLEMISLAVDVKRPQILFVGTRDDGVMQLTMASDLSLTITAPPMTAGLPAVYALNANNSGSLDVTDVRITIQLPASATAVTATSNVGACSTSGSTVTCSLPEMRRNTLVPITLNVTPAAGQFQVTASITGALSDTNSANNTSSDTRNVVDPTASGGTGNSGGSGSGSTNSGGGGSVSIDLCLLLMLICSLRLIAQRGSQIRCTGN